MCLVGVLMMMIVDSDDKSCTRCLRMLDDALGSVSCKAHQVMSLGNDSFRIEISISIQRLFSLYNHLHKLQNKY